MNTVDMIVNCHLSGVVHFALFTGCSPFINLYLESIGMDCVASDSCYFRKILQRNYSVILL